MASQQLVDNYPSLRDITETERLHLQHELVINAFGSLVVCPVNLDRENLRVLDVGTADGWWLEQLRKELKHPESAALIGTDIAPYPGIKENVISHNFKTPFPEEWKGSFDLIQLRAVLSNVPGKASVDLLRRVIGLLKPSGYIQVVDGTLPSGELHASMKPSEEFFTRLGNFLKSNGLSESQGQFAAELLRTAGEGLVDDLDSMEKRLTLGKERSREETDFAWLRGMADVSGRAYLAKGLMNHDDFERLRLAVLEEARQDGIPWPWYAAWARRRTSV